MREVRFEMPFGGTMRGHASGEGELELAIVEHRLDDGTVLRESVWRTPAPPPAPEAPPAEAEPPVDG